MYGPSPNPAAISDYILRLLYDSDFMPQSSIYGKVQATPHNMASEMGLEAVQISTCYEVAGLGKVISYKMTLEIDLMGLEASHSTGEISTGFEMCGGPIFQTNQNFPAHNIQLFGVMASWQHSNWDGTNNSDTSLD